MSASGEKFSAFCTCIDIQIDYGLREYLLYRINKVITINNQNILFGL